mmetsp:Transcript_103335/g.289550  ORF Transcript_103335/g.289550 Transcript_103335/m.289550 type:complete len:595 (+) Transcript_103335:36-1820(+)
MADPAIAKYLSDNIGGVLAKALGEMAVAQPSDGVDFLAQWMGVYIQEEEAKKRRAEEEAELGEARAQCAARRADQAEKRAAQEEAAVAQEAVWRSALATFSDEKTFFEPAFWQQLLAASKVLTGASAVYLGIVEEEGLEGEEGPLIRYVEAAAGSEDMRDRILLKETGVTWGAVTENPPEDVQFLWRPPQPPPEEPNPDDPDAVPEPPPPLPYVPVFVPYVTDVKEIHYFEMTRLGAYLAVPLVYRSFYTAEALAAAKEHEEKKKAKKEEREQLQKAYDEKVEEARASGGEEAVAAVQMPAELEEPEEVPELEMPGKVVRMVLCLDTLGTNELIDEGKIETAMELCNAIGKCKEATESTLVDDQALMEIDEAAREELKQEIEGVRKKWAEEEELQKEQDKEFEETEHEEVHKEMIHELISLRYDYKRDVKVLMELQEAFLALKKWVVAPPEMMNLIAAVCYMFGRTREDIYPKRKPNLNWQVLLEVLDESFVHTLWEAEPTIIELRQELPPERKLSAIKELLPAEFDAEKCQALSPALELLHKVLLSAIAYREKHLQLEKARYEQAKQEALEAAEEGEPPVEIPPPEDDDIDPE